MKFVCDCMLGSLARWLRMLGYDTLYFNYAEDNFLKELAYKEKRMLLTKDRELAFSVKNSLLVEGNGVKEELSFVCTTLSLKRNPMPRCSVCNGELIVVNKKDIEPSVPPYVFLTQNEFLKCLNCKKVYWKGTHAERIENFLKEIL